MKTIDVKKIIVENLLDTSEVALHLFPGNKYPRLALNRVMSGAAVLDADQISKFSLFCGIPIEDLFEGAEWKVVNKKKLLLLTTEDYLAELDTETWTTKLFHKGSLMHESVLHSTSITLKEYILQLNKLIK